MRSSVFGISLALTLVSAPTGVFARDLTVVSWGGATQDAQREAFFDVYKKESGKNLVEDTWDGGIGVLRAKVQGGALPWDVVMVESEELELGCEEGLFENLDFNRIGGEGSYFESAVNPCGVGAALYNYVIAYDRSTKAAPSGWADFFDTNKFPGKRGMRNGPKANLEMALMADGVKPQDVYKVLGTEEGVNRAFAKLDTIKKDIVWWTAGAQPLQMLASGDVSMAWVYNGRVDAANKDDHRNFGIVWNESLSTVDSWVILKGSPNIDDSYAFLKTAGDARNQAQFSTIIAYGGSNKENTKYIQADRLKDLPTSPDNIKNVLNISASFWVDNIDKLNERFSKWASTN